MSYLKSGLNTPNEWRVEDERIKFPFVATHAISVSGESLINMVRIELPL